MRPDADIGSGLSISCSALTGSNLSQERAGQPKRGYDGQVNDGDSTLQAIRCGIVHRAGAKSPRVCVCACAGPVFRGPVSQETRHEPLQEDSLESTSLRPPLIYI